jgi:hypothetical protein
MPQVGHSRWGQAASEPGHVGYAAEAEVSRRSSGERNETQDHVEIDPHIAALMRATTSFALCLGGHASAFAR